jgi:hypothetical protein
MISLEGPEGMLRKAVTMNITLRQMPETVGIVSLRNTGAGHAVPGGPPIRSLLLDVRGYNLNGHEVYSDTTTVFSRVVESPFAPETGLMLPWLGWNELKDDRLYPGQSRSFIFRTENPDVVKMVARLLYIRFEMMVEEDFFGDDDPPVMAYAEARAE